MLSSSSDLFLSVSTRFSRNFALLVILELASLSFLAPLDAAFVRWLDAWRSCQLDYVFFVLKDRPLMILLAVGGLTIGGLCLCRRWGEARHALLVVLVGGFLCELLKTGLERPRPSVLPSLTVGNSFPSGHVTTALLVAGTLSFFLVRSRWPQWLKFSGVGFTGLVVGMTAGQRLYLGHHWLSDVVGSLLLVSSWLCLTLPRPWLFQVSRQSVVAAAGLLLCYGGFYFLPALRIALPSALTVTGTPVVAVSFGEDQDRKGLRGSWDDEFQDPPSLWMYQEAASVEVSLPESGEYLLKIAVRPMLQSKAFACFPLEISVNQQYAGALLLHRGWREYSLLLKPDWTVPGVNAITFFPGFASPHAVSEQRTVAFRHLRLFRKKG